ncbi:GntR family transcriptional regulator [Paraburkholderia dinghuensis]|uniref:GntR family transcriptional regulator n=1 Tax=Paraburkholderia dinghuensis TaxID=2305225 RepID=A0A3N6MYQ6_9BURK|nr:winged helix-turn-helix domain-containing protein [Paraburkholderia dinghuensis]RQH01622.1 GntR family transcriptional regulator [Paraburkholderia dinghuensis]
MFIHDIAFNLGHARWRYRTPGPSGYPIVPVALSSKKMNKRVRANWIPRLSVEGKPKWLQIISSLEKAISSGELRVGDSLLSQRHLADLIGVHVNTVNRAMHEAVKRGLIVAKTRRGMVVGFDGLAQVRM